MELKELVAVLRRNVWVLLAGLGLGLLTGYLVSIYAEPVYEANAKIMISRQVQEINPDFIGLSSQQLVQTYVQILQTTPLLDTTAERTGVDIDEENVTVQQILETPIIEIIVEDITPEDAAQIANTMATVLVEQNEKIQEKQYTATEERLNQQIDYVIAQIELLQTEYDQTYTNDYNAQLDKVEKQIADIQAELSPLQTEIENLGSTGSQADNILIAQRQSRIAQLQEMVLIYEQIRANLLILGRPLQYGTSEISPKVQQLQATIDLYQGLQLSYVENLESVKLTRLQQAPSIIQIETAVPAEKPLRPIPWLYTFMSGLTGLVLAVMLIFFMHALQEE